MALGSNREHATRERIREQLPSPQVNTPGTALGGLTVTPDDKTGRFAK
jgi:hypothetical protein